MAELLATTDGNPYRVEECKSCSAPVIWCVTHLGKRMPVDAEPADGGNVAIQDHGGDLPLASVLTVTVTQQFGRTGLRKSHFATCPDGPAWRRGRRRS